MPVTPRLFGESFAADPAASYTALRHAGPVAWAELSPEVHGLVVTGHTAAMELLSSPRGTYSRDSRNWSALAHGKVPPDSPLLGILGWQPSVMHTDGDRHKRLSGVISDCMARIRPHHLADVTTGVAERLIDKLTNRRTADLVGEYAMAVPLLVFTDLLGCPRALAQRMVDACAGIIDADEHTPAAVGAYGACLAELVALKQTQPADDLTTWLLTHNAHLSHDEVIANLYTLIGAGNVPTATWIVQTLQLLLTDIDHAGDVTAGTVAVDHAMRKALWDACPVGVFSWHIALTDTTLAGIPVPAGTLVMIAHRAVNTDPALPQEIGFESRAHLAFGAGQHRCPVPVHAAIITKTAVAAALDRLWNLRLADPNRPAPNRPGLFHHCPQSLYVTYTPA